MSVQKVITDIHANPQFRRETVFGLNGEWEFEILDTPFETGLIDRPLNGRINVPFCPESALSGIGCKGVIQHCAYAKNTEIPACKPGGGVLLRFGACDYECAVFVNGMPAGRHRGGYAPFCLDVTRLVRPGKNRIFVLVHDDVAADCPSGKQSAEEKSLGCFYSRVTGIWQSVWLEFVPAYYLRGVRFYPDCQACSVRLDVECEGEGEVVAEVYYRGKKTGEARFFVTQRGTAECALSEKHLWELGKGRLYDVVLRFCGDTVYTYFGMRECGFNGKKFMLNGKCVFQRLVLDQGYHPEGLYTYPDAASMRRSIDMALKLGFNGARLHQKIFEPQFLYECDRAGFLIWEELPSWGINYTDLYGIGGVLDEWAEIVERDFNHPSIVLWCLGNEFWTDEFHKNSYLRVCDMRYVTLLCKFTKILDGTRPCVDSSGGYHTRETDLYDFHTYADAESVRGYLEKFQERDVLEIPLLMPPRVACNASPYGGGDQPVMASEYGGIALLPEGDGWGYITVKTPEELCRRAVELSSLFMGCAKLSGMCYTQLYDVEQEQNGLYYYDRTPKLTQAQMREMKAVLAGKAAIEEE